MQNTNCSPYSSTRSGSMEETNTKKTSWFYQSRACFHFHLTHLFCCYCCHRIVLHKYGIEISRCVHNSFEHRRTEKSKGWDKDIIPNLVVIHIHSVSIHVHKIQIDEKVNIAYQQLEINFLEKWKPNVGATIGSRHALFCGLCTFSLSFDSVNF